MMVFYARKNGSLGKFIDQTTNQDMSNDAKMNIQLHTCNCGDKKRRLAR
jgi:hypothetical protein